MTDGKRVVAAASLEELQRWVHVALCQRDRLDPGQTPIFRGRVRKAGKVCGMFFQIEGPRLMRAYALWVADEHRILFYDSAGIRFEEVLLSEAPLAA